MSLEKTASGWQHMLLQNLYISFCINGAVTDVQVTHSIGTDTPPYHDRRWLLDLTLMTAWMVFFLFGLENTTAVLSKNYLKC
uniref:Uncharacterized protein n=1 Tax=Anguilla anguilla TaxID=7936 RepID=A0A0E9RE37_ANGAN